jgi:hypothetical protein
MRTMRVADAARPKLHLDHDDYDRTKLRDFAHAACNIRAVAKKARAIQIAAKMAKTRAGRPVHGF